MKWFISFITVFTIFLDEFVITRVPVDFYFYYLIFVFVIGLYYAVSKQLPINKNFILILFAVFVVSFVKTQINSYPILPTIKQIAGIILSSIPYYLIIKLNNYNVRDIFVIYIKACYIICFLGIFQELSYLIFHIDYRYQFKVTSIVSEPSHLAITLAPAFFVSINKLFFKSKTFFVSTKGAALIFITWLLTMSAVAILGLITSVILIALNKYSILSFRIKLIHAVSIAFASVVLALSLYGVYLHVPFIKFRVDDTWRVINPDKSQKMDDVNLSTYAIYSNLQVTKEAFLENPLLGSGLGTHSYNYDRYIDEVYNFKNPNYRKIELNKEDANSLFLRLISELGLVGLMLFLLFLYSKSLKFIKGDGSAPLNDLWLINNGCLLFFIMRLMRFGNYSVLGSFLFIFVFYFSYKQFIELRPEFIKKEER